mgnify:CR=1 FL=1
MAEEAAIELKHVLDYVFNNARSQIVIPDSEEMKNIIETRPSKNESWRLPGTTITLTTKQSEEDVESGVEYYFAESTVKNIRNKFMKIYDRSIKESKNEFTTPFFYSDYIYNPGYLVPPKWYLNLPEPILNFKNIRIGEQTIFQSVLAIGALIVYALIVFTLIRKVLNSYNRQNDNQTLQVNSDWADGVKAWKRFLLLLPILPLTDLLEIFVDEYVKTEDEESFIMARRLIKEEGFLCGGSCGSAMVAALKSAKHLDKDKKCLVVLPDSIRNYMTKFPSDQWMKDQGFKV